MDKVRAPEGYEGSRCYIDGSRSYNAYARPIGGTWWTDVGSCGVAGTPPEELDARAEERIATAIRIGVVK